MNYVQHVKKSIRKKMDGEFTSIRLADDDENSTYLDQFHGKAEKYHENHDRGVIKLRDLNTGTQRPMSRKTLELVEYLRKPEPTLDVKLKAKSPELGFDALKEVRTMYIPESPSLLRTLSYNTGLNSSEIKLIKMDDGSTLDLTPVSKIYDGEYEFDCQPFYRTYDYENRLEADDYNPILNKMVQDDLNNTKPIFYRELEYRELKRIVQPMDYFLYYVFGIDRLNFFQLKEVRDKFNEFNYQSYTCPLKYRDPELPHLNDDNDDDDDNDDNVDYDYDPYEPDPILCDASSVMSLDVYV